MVITTSMKRLATLPAQTPDWVNNEYLCVIYVVPSFNNWIRLCRSSDLWICTFVRRMVYNLCLGTYELI